MVDSVNEIYWMFKAFYQGIDILEKIGHILKEFDALEQICKCYATSEIDDKKSRMTFHYLWAPLYIKIRLYRYIANNLPRYEALLDWGFLIRKEKR